MTAGDPYPNFSVTFRTNKWEYTTGDTIAVTRICDGIKYTYAPSRPQTIWQWPPPITEEDKPNVRLDYDEISLIDDAFTEEERGAVNALILALKELFDGDQ